MFFKGAFSGQGCAIIKAVNWNLQEENVKVKRCVKGRRLCFAIFAICLSARFIEYFLIETDKTPIAYNIAALVLVIIAVALLWHQKWRSAA